MGISEIFLVITLSGLIMEQHTVNMIKVDSIVECEARGKVAVKMLHKTRASRNMMGKYTDSTVRTATFECVSF